MSFTIQIRTSRKRRKTMAIKIIDGGIEVQAPHRIRQQEIDNFIAAKRVWIEAKLQAQSMRAAAQKPFLNGEDVMVQGVPHYLHIDLAAPPRIEQTAKGLRLGLPQQVQHNSLERKENWIREKLTQWLREQAEHVLPQRTEFYSAKIGLTPRAVIVKNYKARWGACSHKGEIFYNWRLIMAPPSILDYVVVHELCHMLEHNHSPAFWGHVETHYPDYKAARHWLRENGHSLAL